MLRKLEQCTSMWVQVLIKINNHSCFKILVSLNVRFMYLFYYQTKWYFQPCSYELFNSYKKVFFIYFIPFLPSFLYFSAYTIFLLSSPCSSCLIFYFFTLLSSLQLSVTPYCISVHAFGIPGNCFSNVSWQGSCIHRLFLIIQTAGSCPSLSSYLIHPSSPPPTTHTSQEVHPCMYFFFMDTKRVPLMFPPC